MHLDLLTVGAGKTWQTFWEGWSRHELDQRVRWDNGISSHECVL